MSDIKTLEKEYKDLVKKTHSLSEKIIEHLHIVFDDKLNDYKNWDEFLEDVNYYAGDTFGKLMYINFAKNVMEGKTKSPQSQKQTSYQL